MISAISKQRTLGEIHRLNFNSYANYNLSSLIWYQRYFSQMKIIINISIWIILPKKIQFQKTLFEDKHLSFELNWIELNWKIQFEDRYLSDRDLKLKEQKPHLFWNEAKSWTEFEFKTNMIHNINRTIKGRNQKRFKIIYFLYIRFCKTDFPLYVSRLKITYAWWRKTI